MSDCGHLTPSVPHTNPLNLQSRPGLTSLVTSHSALHAVLTTVLHPPPVLSSALYPLTSLHSIDAAMPPSSFAPTPHSAFSNLSFSATSAQLDRNPSLADFYLGGTLGWSRVVASVQVIHYKAGLSVSSKFTMVTGILWNKDGDT